MLFEPDAAIRSALTTLLREAGWQVLLGSAGKMPDSADVPSSVGCILSDLPSLSDSAEQLLKAAKARGLPLIFMGRGVAVQSVVDMLHGGALDYLEKPFKPNRLIRLLEPLRRQSLKADG